MSSQDKKPPSKPTISAQPSSSNNQRQPERAVDQQALAPSSLRTHLHGRVPSARSLLQLQRTIGNRAVTKLLRSAQASRPHLPTIQRVLAVNELGPKEAYGKKATMGIWDALMIVYGFTEEDIRGLKYLDSLDGLHQFKTWKEAAHHGKNLLAKEKPFGIVTWNAAHFSDKDSDNGQQDGEETDQENEDSSENEDNVDDVGNENIEVSRDNFNVSLQYVMRKLVDFDDKGWVKFFKNVERHVKNMIDAFGEYKQNPKDFDFSRLQSVSSKLKQLEQLLRDITSSIEAFDYNKFKDELISFRNYDWENNYKEAREDHNRRISFAKEIKGFREFGDYVQYAKYILGMIRKLDDFASISGRMLEEDLDIQGVITEQRKEISENLLNKSEIDQIGRLLHTHNIALQTQDMFKNNPWLDVIALQEINNPTLLQEENTLYDIASGPHLMSGGKNPQHEYYPLLIRKDAGITPKKVYIVKTDGTMQEVNHDEEVHWDKRANPKEYRPIVVYEVTRNIGEEDQQTIWIGVVHTTPVRDKGGKVSEYNRSNIYKEIDKGLATLSQLAQNKKIPLIIGGDYYLSAEAVVKDLPKNYPEKKKDQSIVKKTKQSSNKDYALLKAEKETYEQLLDDVKQIEIIDLKIQNLEKDAEDDTRKNRRKSAQGQLMSLYGDKVIILSRHSVEESNQLILKAEKETNKYKDIINRMKHLEEARTDKQILRNQEHLRLTAQQQMEDEGYTIDQTVTGTNPKKDPLVEWFHLQIADFFIHKRWLTAKVGLMRPEGQMVSIDKESLQHSQYWQSFSDHFPIGGIFSFQSPESPSFKETLSNAFVQHPDAQKAAQELNVKHFAFLFLKQRFDALADKVKRHEMVEEAEQEYQIPDMTAQAYINMIWRLEQELGIPIKKRFIRGRHTIDEIKARAKKLSELKKQKDPEFDSATPSYNDYIEVYLGEIKKIAPNEIEFLGGSVADFRNNQLLFAVTFLKQKLNKLEKKFTHETHMDIPEENLDYHVIEAYIKQIQILEEKLLLTEKIKEKDTFVVFRPEDFEPESSKIGALGEGRPELTGGMHQPVKLPEIYQLFMDDFDQKLKMSPKNAMECIVQNDGTVIEMANQKPLLINGLLKRLVAAASDEPPLVFDLCIYLAKRSLNRNLTSLVNQISQASLLKVPDFVISLCSLLYDVKEPQSVYKLIMVSLPFSDQEMIMRLFDLMMRGRENIPQNLIYSMVAYISERIPDFLEKALYILVKENHIREEERINLMQIAAAPRMFNASSLSDFIAKQQAIGQSRTRPSRPEREQNIEEDEYFQEAIRASLKDQQPKKFTEESLMSLDKPELKEIIVKLLSSTDFYVNSEGGRNAAIKKAKMFISKSVISNSGLIHVILRIQERNDSVNLYNSLEEQIKLTKENREKIITDTQTPYDIKKVKIGNQLLSCTLTHVAANGDCGFIAITEMMQKQGITFGKHSTLTRQVMIELVNDLITERVENNKPFEDRNKEEALGWIESLINSDLDKDVNKPGYIEEKEILSKQKEVIAQWVSAFNGTIPVWFSVYHMGFLSNLCNIQFIANTVDMVDDQIAFVPSGVYDPAAPNGQTRKILLANIDQTKPFGNLLTHWEAIILS